MYLQYLCNKQQKKTLKKKYIFFGILKATEEKSRIRIRNPVYGSEDLDLDPY
jgi:hypothetical protein